MDRQRMRTLVEDDPEQEPVQANIDSVVVEKTETFWSFLQHLGSSMNNARKHGIPKPLKKMLREVWNGKKSRK